ncbi:hypothetical protein QBC36DRAFT_112223 [Triangularia setosa]|uniref:Uncharacterized protein n=1 Tax=Triangularia setosa TaxID=2587417 RepID=A0AAN6VWU5_9PEZI|nr:hypothetical protein QBC36DRAFT_112223 [Podospora setosa]
MSSRHSSSPSRPAVSSRQSTPARSDRQRSSSSSPARPSSRDGPRYALGNIRVVAQDAQSPYTVVPLANTSRTFRFAVYCITFAINLLQSQKGRSALIGTGIEVWSSWNSRSRRGIRLQQDPRRHPELMEQAVDQFLESIRNDPPNIIVSTRVRGEGKTQRLDWNDYLDGEYTAKYGAIFRLNKTIIDNAVYAADNNHREDFERFCFLMGLATAHELVHTFVGYLTGDSGTDTPPRVQFPFIEPSAPTPVSRAEAGRFWEGKLLGFLVQAWEDPRNPLGDRQAGEMLGLDQQSRHYALGQGWMRSWAFLNFAVQPVRSAARVSLGRGRRTLQDTERRKQLFNANDIPDSVDKTEFIEYINSLPVHRLPATLVRDIMSMPAHPSRIRA